MGQCVSRKGAHALAARSSAPPRSPPSFRRTSTTRSTTTILSHKSRNHSTHASKHHMANNKFYSSLRVPIKTEIADDTNKGATTKQRSNVMNSGPVTRGTAISFGFRRRPVSASNILLQDNSNNRITNELIDSNGNGRMGPLMHSDSVPNEQSNTYMHNLNLSTTTTSSSASRQHKLQQPSSGGAQNRSTATRFGFKSGTTNKMYTNKVGDSQHNPYTQSNLENKNNNLQRQKSSTTITADQNKNKHHLSITASTPISQISKYKLHTSSLPKPQMPVRLSDKNIKQYANHARKQHSSSTIVDHHDSSSKEGSVTEDSGVSSHTSDQADLDSVNPVQLLDSPIYRTNRRQRQLEMVVKGKHFDVRDLTDDGTVIESSLIPLPKLPSVFQNESSSNTSSDIRQNTLVRERAKEYQRNIQQQQQPPQLMQCSSSSSSSQFEPADCMIYSTTSEESTEEKVRRDRALNEKTYRQTTILLPNKKSQQDTSLGSSDTANDCAGGEAMIDNCSLNLSSDEDRKPTIENLNKVLTATVTPRRANLTLNTSQNDSSITREVLLTIEDPKFAAVAASVTGNLLEDETSPVDSLISSCTDSEDIGAGKLTKEKSNKMTESKDINERALQSPGTPTNASLSLSDGKDFFDDEIADQPSLLVFDSAGANNDIVNSENTMIEEMPSAAEAAGVNRSKQSSFAETMSPMHQRKLNPKIASIQRASSLDTLSPCESIASDDLMMDFEQSLSSAFDDSTDRLDSKFNSGHNSLDFNDVKDVHRDVRQEWSALLNKRNKKEDSPSLSNVSGRPGSRLQQTLKCRTEQFGSGGSHTAPDSPRSLDGYGGSRSRVPSTSSASHSPLRLSRRYAAITTANTTLSAGATASSSPTAVNTAAYDSDDSIRLDRGTHDSMLQDIVGVKTMLLKLTRVLQEPDEELLKRSETLNPFESPLKNGRFHNSNNNDNINHQALLDAMTADDRFELADLRRQVLFLQAQLEDRERTVQQLRQQVAVTSNSAPTSICESTTEMCNAATQTDRIRPMSAGPSLLNSFPTDSKGGPLVSLNNSNSANSNNRSSTIRKHHRRLPTLSLSEYRPPVATNNTSDSFNNSTGNLATSASINSHQQQTSLSQQNLLRVFTNNKQKSNGNIIKTSTANINNESSSISLVRNRSAIIQSRPVSPSLHSHFTTKTTVILPTRRSLSQGRIRITST